MAGHSQQPGISNNTSNTTQPSYQQTHNVPPYYPLSTQHSDPVLLSLHGVPQNQHNTQHGTILAYHTSQPPFFGPSIPHPLPAAGSHLNTLSGSYLPQESVTGNMQQNVHSNTSSRVPSLRHPSLTYLPSIRLPTNNSYSYSYTNQFLYQRQTVPTMNTPPVHFSVVERSLQSSPYENIPLPLTTQSDDELIMYTQPQATMIQQLSSRGNSRHAPSVFVTESHIISSLNPSPAKVIRLDTGNSSHDDVNNTRLPDDNEDDDSMQSSDYHSETQQQSLASFTQATSASSENLNFCTLFKVLYPACLKWHNLGLALGLDNTTLECIRKRERDDCDECLRSMIQKLDTTSERLTWEKISQALENPTVEMEALAQTVRTQNSPLYMPCQSSDITPGFFSRYVNILKDKYKEMSIFPDDWPPPLEEKFSKLALIERKQQKIPQAKHTQSIEYDYATGNVDNIVTKKQEIELEQIFNPLLDNSQSAKQNRFIVLMDGAPGVGKTTLTRKICIDWAEGKLLTDHQIVILKPLREMRGHTTASLSDILSNGPELNKVIEYIQDKLGLGVMFIFDGFDELSSKQQLDKNALFWRIVQGTDLHKCSVLVTSRAYASGPLQNIIRINRHVEVLGFKKEDIERCIKQNIKDKEKAKNLLQMLKQRLDIVSLCYIPLNCRIVLHVYQQLSTLPDTLTQLYEVFILYTIKHYKDKLLQQLEEDIDDIEIDHANKINQLPLPVKKHLEFLSQIAFTGMTEDKLVFDYAEVKAKKGAQSLGLLNQITCTGGLEAHYYQFLHLTIQEFLAARHLASVKSNDSEMFLEFFKTNISKDRFRMTLIFLSGLTQLYFLKNEKAFPILKPIDLRVKHSHINKTDKQEKDYFIFLAHILYESQQTIHNWLLPCLKTNSLNFSRHTLTQFECLVLANFLAMTPEDHVWDDINLTNRELTNSCFKILSDRRHQKLDIVCLCLTKKISIYTKPLKTANDLLTTLLRKESKVESLNIPFHYFPPSCKTIKNYDSSNKTPVELFIKIKRRYTGEIHYLITITSCEISFKQFQDRLSFVKDIKFCSGVVTKLLEYSSAKNILTFQLEYPEALENCFECNTSGRDAWESVLKLCQYVKNKIQISKKYFNGDDISSLIESLKYNQTLLHIRLATENNISYDNLVRLKTSIRASMTVTMKRNISLFEEQKLILSIDNDKYIHIEDITKPYDTIEQNLLTELQRVIVSDTLGHASMRKNVLISLGKSGTVTDLILKHLCSFSLQGLDEMLMPITDNFQNVSFESTQTLQTLTLDDCELSDTFIKHLENRLSHNTTVALNIKSSDYSVLSVRSQNLQELDMLSLLDLTKERVSQLAEIITTCKQLRVLKLVIENNSEVFFNALSGNESLRELEIHTTSKSLILLFQTLPSTSITTLELRCLDKENTIKDELSIVFKEFVRKNQVLAIVKVGDCKLTNEAFGGITFTHDSPLTELSIFRSIEQDGFTNLSTSLMSSHVTTLNIKIESMDDGTSYQAFKELLISNKLTVLGVETNSFSCIAEALSQNCSLQELTITGNAALNNLDQQWTKLFQSLHCNTTLQTLICKESHSETNENAKGISQSLCEMLQHNKHLQNLTIRDKFIEDYLQEFIMFYTKRQPTLNLTVETREMVLKFVKEIEKLQLDIDFRYCIKHLK